MTVPDDAIVVPLRAGRVAVVRGWHSRYSAHPDILRVAREAEASDHHERLYRGDRNLRTRHLFLVGEKARPLHHKGEVARLDRGSVEKLAGDEDAFASLVESYLRTGMAKRRPVQAPGAGVILDTWRGASPAERYAIALALLGAMQSQNSRKAVADWKDYLWFLSCTRGEAIALKYALGGRAAMPMTSIVVEYAPRRGLVLPVAQFADLIDKFRLGQAFPDIDAEVFAMNALLPHHILGYSRISRVEGIENAYDTSFVPHEYYNHPGSSIHAPPDLNAAQRDVFDETRDTLAWVESRNGDWRQVYDPRGPRPLGPPVQPE